MNYKQYKRRTEQDGSREYAPSLGNDLMRHMQKVQEEGMADAEAFAIQLLESDEADIETLRADFIREFGRHKVEVFDELAEESTDGPPPLSRFHEANKYDKDIEKKVKQWIAKEFTDAEDKKAAGIAWAVVNKYGTKDKDNLTGEYDKKIDRADVGGGHNHLVKIQDKVIDYVDSLLDNKKKEATRYPRRSPGSRKINEAMGFYGRDMEKAVYRWIDRNFKTSLDQSLAYAAFHAVNRGGVEREDDIADWFENELESEGLPSDDQAYEVLNAVIDFVDRA